VIPKVVGIHGVVLFAITTACAPPPAPVVDCEITQACAEVQTARVLSQTDDMIENGEHMRAIADIATAYACDGEVMLLFEAGRVYQAAGEHATAQAYYERYLSTGDSTRADEARVEIEACEAATSLPSLDTILGGAPCDRPVNYLVQSGADYFSAGVYDGAITIFESAFACDQDPILQYNIGRVYQEAGRCGLARDAFQAYVDSSDNRVRTEALEYLNEMAMCAARQ